jgi:hypothetical protein
VCIDVGVVVSGEVVRVQLEQMPHHRLVCELRVQDLDVDHV